MFTWLRIAYRFVIHFLLYLKNTFVDARDINRKSDLLNEILDKKRDFDWYGKETVIRRVKPTPLLCLVKHDVKTVKVFDCSGRFLYDTTMCKRCNDVDMSREKQLT